MFAWGFTDVGAGNVTAVNGGAGGAGGAEVILGDKDKGAFEHAPSAKVMDAITRRLLVLRALALV